MSATSKLTPNLSNFYEILAVYENDLAECQQNLTIKGKTLEFALKEQPTWSAYYGERAAELSSLVKFMDMHVNRIRGHHTVRYKENYNPALSERMMDKYIDKEEDFLDMYEMYLEVKELHEKYVMVLEAFNRRGFALRDITQSRIAEIQGVTL